MNDKLITSHLIGKGYRAEDLSTHKPMVVELYATWSGSCHIMEPVFENLVEIYGGKINFHKVNIDEFPEITEHYGVRKIPTILIFNKGGLVDYAVGAISRTDLASKLERVLKAKFKKNS